MFLRRWSVQPSRKCKQFGAVISRQMLNIVVPMAGRGSRFADAGYQLPKPLIPIHGVPMIGMVVKNIKPRRPHRFIFVCLEEHLEPHEEKANLREREPDCAASPSSGVREGEA